MSSHADREGLLKWIDAFESKPETVFIVHGERETCKSFTARLIGEGFKAIAPKYSAMYDLLTGEAVFEGRDIIRRDDPDSAERRESAVYQRLLRAGMRLLEVITRNRGGTNKDLAKFADQIDSLTSKWDR